jgi:hypothetical protein
VSSEVADVSESEHVAAPLIVCFTPVEPWSDVTAHVPGAPVVQLRVNLNDDADNVPDAFFHASCHSSWQSFNACADVVMDIIIAIVESIFFVFISPSFLFHAITILNFTIPAQALSFRVMSYLSKKTLPSFVPHTFLQNPPGFCHSRVGGNRVYFIETWKLTREFRVMSFFLSFPRRRE